MSERELAATATYLWLSFLQDQGGEEETTFASVAGGAELFANRPQTELLAIQLWIMCQLSMDADLCDAHLLLNYGRCFCVSYKELLAIRVYLLGQFIGNFVQVDLDPDTLHHFIEEFASNISMSMFEATTTWLMCQLYDVALQNQQPT